MLELRESLKNRFQVELPDELLVLALTHPSAAVEAGDTTLNSNQRLEFLGDAVIGAVVAEHFYVTEPNLPEGELTTRKIAAVRREALSSAAKRLKLGDFLVFGVGEGRSGGGNRSSNLADGFEALVGAVFVGCGWDTAKKFTLEALSAELAIDTNRLISAKSRLQEFTQANGLGTPRYVTVLADGQAHVFSAEVLLLEIVRGRGAGGSKKVAEEAAAASAYSALIDQRAGVMDA